MANKKNLASGTLVAGITTSSTTLSVYVGDGNSSTIEGVWPTTPFFITVMPPAPDAGVANSLDSEVMQVTAVSSDLSGNTTLTVTRAQKSTTAKAFDEGSVVTNAIYPDEVAMASGTVGSLTTPVYVNNGEIQGCKTFTSGATWNIVPKVGGDGVMEIGRYIDFHNANADTGDNTLRIDNYDTNKLLFVGSDSDLQLSNGANQRLSLRDVCTNAFQNGTDVIRVTAGSDDWSKDFDNIVFPKNFGAAVLVSEQGNIWANNPTGTTSYLEHWYLVQEQYNANSNAYARQYCSDVNTSDGNYVWYRERHSGSWSAWQRVATNSDLSTIIGNLSNLTTTDKTNVVSAINEVDSALDDAAYVGPVLSTPTSVDYVATDNIQDGAVTNSKIAANAVKSNNIDFTTSAAWTTVVNASDTGAYATIAYRKTGGLVELKVQNAAVKNITIPNGLTTLISSGIPAVSTPFYAVLAAGNGASILLDVRGTSLSIWNPGSAITTNVLVGHTMYIASS